MGFMNSAFLWGGLGLLGVSVPVIIHLLKRYRVIQWGAMALLLKTLKRRRRKIRMEDLIVLLLRCLALLLLALALMRPTILSRGGAWLMGASRVGMVIAIDASYSMAHGEVGSRFDQARRQAKAILSTVKPGDPVTIVLMGSRPHVLAGKVGYEERRVDKILDEAQALPEHLNLEFCLERVRQLMAEMKTPVRECYIISDGQAATWKTLTDKAVAELGAMVGAGDTTAAVYFVQVSSGHEENLAITRLEFAGGTVRRGASARFVAEIANYGLQPRDQITVSLEVDGRTVDARVLRSLGPGLGRVVAFTVPFTRSGAHRLTARIEGDPALAIDNVRYAVVDVPESTRILCVDGDESILEKHKSETYFLRKALDLKGYGPAVGLNVETISPQDLAGRNLKEEDFIILANVADIPNETVAALSSAVRGGTGLLIFLGDKIDPIELNSTFGTEKGLLPAELLERVELDEGNEASLEVADIGHPVGRVLGRLPQDMLASARFWGHIGLRTMPASRTVLRLSNGSPLVVEKAVGRGRVVLFASSADRAWNDLAVNPVNPIWIHNMVSYMTSAGRTAYDVGQPLRMSVDARLVSPVMSCLTPGGETLKGKVEELDGQALVDLGFTKEPGFYEVQLIKGAGSLVLAANVSAVESDVKSLAPEELGAALAETGVQILPADADTRRTVKERRVGYEIWRTLLTIGLAALVAQAFLSDRYSRRMMVGTEDIKPGVGHAS